jgi:hypothetical protein
MKESEIAVIRIRGVKGLLLIQHKDVEKRIRSSTNMTVNHRVGDLIIQHSSFEDLYLSAVSVADSFLNSLGSLNPGILDPFSYPSSIAYHFVGWTIWVKKLNCIANNRF